MEWEGLYELGVAKAVQEIGRDVILNFVCSISLSYILRLRAQAGNFFECRFLDFELNPRHPEQKEVTPTHRPSRYSVRLFYMILLQGVLFMLQLTIKL